MRQESGRERYYRQIRQIREELGVSHAEARRRWGNYFEEGGVPIRPLKRVTFTLRPATSTSSTCPFCRDNVSAEDEDSYTCESCSTLYHLECFGELGDVCATLGCARQPSRPEVRARRRQRVRIANEPDSDRSFFAMLIMAAILISLLSVVFWALLG